MFLKKKLDYSMIDPSSKMALKMSCLQQADGDVKKAEELYRFLSDGVESMPDYPVQHPSAFQQIQQAAGNIFGWVKENQNDIVNAFSFIQQLRSGSPVGTAATPPVDIPPVPPIK